MRKRLAIFIFSILLMLLTVSFFGINKVLQVLLTSDISYVFLAVLCQIIIICLYGLRLKAVSSKYKSISYKDALYTSIVGNFVSQITPVAKIGGQPLMIYLLKKDIGSEKASAAVIVDTVIDFIVSTLLIIGILIVFYGSIPYIIFLPLLVFAIITLVLILGFIKMFLSKNALARLIDWSIEKLKRFKRIDKIFHTQIFQNSFKTFLHDRKILSLSAALTLLVKAFELARIWLVFAAISIFLPLTVLIIVWAIIVVLLTIPWLPGSLGLYEFGAASAFVVLGLMPSQAAGGILLERFISFWFVIVFSAIVATISKNKLSSLFAMSEKKELQ